MKRLLEQSACIHSYFGDCTFKTDSGDPCPGGTSREVEIDYEAAAKRVVAILGYYGILNVSDGGLEAESVVDAALGEGT